MPSIWSAAKIVTWDSSLTMTGNSGAPNRPWRSTSQPLRASSACRPAAIPVNEAIVAPVVKPTLTPAGSPNSSASHPPATSSATAAAGPMTYSPAFWSQALVSQSAATAAGTPPPITNPKKRGPALPTSPPSAFWARASTTSTGSSPTSGSDPPKRRRSSSTGTLGATGRSGRPAMNSRAISAARSSAASVGVVVGARFMAGPGLVVTGLSIVVGYTGSARHTSRHT